MEGEKAGSASGCFHTQDTKHLVKSLNLGIKNSTTTGISHRLNSPDVANILCGTG